MNPLPPRPEAPEPGDCCGSGCVRCVFDVYEERLREWEQWAAGVPAPTESEPQPPSG